jgi:hypothetical protein
MLSKKQIIYVIAAFVGGFTIAYFVIKFLKS